MNSNAQKLSLFAVSSSLFLLTSLHNKAEAQGLGAEDDVRVMLNTAGYSAIFGAAMGAALLPFVPNPGFSSLRYVAAGASVGFFIGSGIALYRIANPDGNHTFAPEPADQDSYEDGGYSEWHRKSQVSPAAPDANQVAPLHQGALFVSDGTRASVSVPAFAIGKEFAAFQVLDLRF